MDGDECTRRVQVRLCYLLIILAIHDQARGDESTLVTDTAVSRGTTSLMRLRSRIPIVGQGQRARRTSSHRVGSQLC
jgi:hypothetical protein